MAASVDQKLLRQTKFPPEFNQKVDIQKINVEVMKKWIAGKITEILKSEDDIVIELCFGLLERSRFPDIKSLQISLTGFLDKDAPKFCQELWNLCLSAQSSPRGVAKELLEAKKAELLQEKVDSERAIEEARQQKEGQASRERDIDSIRQREKAERGRGRGRGGNGRGDLEPPRSNRGGRQISHQISVPLTFPPSSQTTEQQVTVLIAVCIAGSSHYKKSETTVGSFATQFTLSLTPTAKPTRATVVVCQSKPNTTATKAAEMVPFAFSIAHALAIYIREKRRRSLQRYDPAARHRRNTSSVSSPEQKRRKRKDSTNVMYAEFSQAAGLRQPGGDEEDATQVFTPHFLCSSATVVFTSPPFYSSAPSTPGSGPPPGFNIEEAKKPLPKEDGKTASAPAAVQPDKSDSQLQGSKTSAAPGTSAATAATTTPPTTKDATLTDLAVEKTKAATGGKEVAAKKEDKKKMTIGQRIKHELDHYWQGTKLLAAEVKISMKLALKMAAGYELSRREHRQLQRTVQDLGRLVPFSVFVIVPFAELLLPVALSLFPNMLPSTYESQHSREAKATRLSETRKTVSTFLRNTLRETSFPVSSKSAKKEEFQKFFRKVRATGESPTREDVIKVCKIFKDDLTLDNLSRPQLVGMCKYMNLNSFGTDAWLRYHIRHRMRQIKRDDKAISFEGVDSLSVPELQMACAARGIRTYGMSPARLREDLQLWLDLRLKYNIPSTLLVLSNAFMYTSGKDSEINSQIDALQAVLSAIPEELFHEMELEVHNAEGAATNKQRLEVLKEQQGLIEEENKQKQAASSKNEAGVPVGEEVKDDKDIDEKPVPKTDKAAVAKEATKATGAAEAQANPEAQQQQQSNKEEAVTAAQVKKD
ncbi:hypothetical protein DV738_g2189, partial [Chaetothyriales sp. CBS 135597]